MLKVLYKFFKTMAAKRKNASVHPSQSPIIQLGVVFIVLFALVMMLYIGKNFIP